LSLESVANCVTTPIQHTHNYYTRLALTFATLSGREKFLAEQWSTYSFPASILRAEAHATAAAFHEGASYGAAFRAAEMIYDEKECLARTTRLIERLLISDCPHTDTLSALSKLMRPHSRFSVGDIAGRIDGSPAAARFVDAFRRLYDEYLPPPRENRRPWWPLATVFDVGQALVYLSKFGTDKLGRSIVFDGDSVIIC
jgi:hypothetical protein